MELPKTAVEELQGIYKQEFGKELEFFDAKMMATKLLQLCVALQNADGKKERATQS